jgi:hypothetical protein
MLNLEKKYTKSQRRIKKKRESNKQKIELRKIQNRRNRKFRQKAKKNQFDSEMKKSRRLRDIARIKNYIK